MTDDAKYGCDVCLGTGTYPIINRHGQDLYAIPCPECHRRDLALLASTDTIDSRRRDKDLPLRSGKDGDRF